MAQYHVKITVQATRLPDPIPVPAFDPGNDPLCGVVSMMRDAMPRGVPFYPGAYRESGLTLGKEVEISIESFQDLVKALGLFDELADRIQCNNPAENP
jgi:hypothetical protein